MKLITNIFSSFLHDEDGFIITSEFLLIGTVAVLGLLVGIQNIRNSLLYEIEELGAVIGKLNQSYSFAGISKGDVLNGGASTQGGLFQDTIDESEEELSTTTIVLEDPSLFTTSGGED